MFQTLVSLPWTQGLHKPGGKKSSYTVHSSPREIATQSSLFSRTCGWSMLPTYKLYLCRILVPDHQTICCNTFIRLHPNVKTKTPELAECFALCATIMYILFSKHTLDFLWKYFQKYFKHEILENDKIILDQIWYHYDPIFHLLPLVTMYLFYNAS